MSSLSPRTAVAAAAAATTPAGSTMGDALIRDDAEMMKAEAAHEEEVIEKMNEAEEKILAPLIRDTSPEARAARKRFMLRAVCGELVGSTLFFFVITAFGVHISRLTKPADAASATLINGVGSMMVLTPLIYSFADISGAHFNPAVTFACWIARKTSNRKCILFILAQLLGSCIAMLLLWACFPEDTHMFTTVALTPQVSDLGRVFAMEFFQTFVLVFVIFALVFDDVENAKRETMTFKGIANSRGLTVYAATPQSKTGFVPIAIGMLVGALNMFGGSISGGGFNPARLFGPALFSGVWTDLWLYWIAQLCGGACGAWLRLAFGVFGVPRDKKKVVTNVAAATTLQMQNQQNHEQERRASDVEINLHRH